MKEYYELFKDSKNFTPEKSLSFDGLAEAIPGMAQQLTNRMWLPLIESPSDYYPEIVLEFYAAY